MTRKEERKQAAVEESNKIVGFEDSDITIPFVRGAEWADEHPRTDVIQRDSISFCRMLLISKFCNIAKKHNEKTMDEVPEMKEAYDAINNFDKACESVGYKYNEEMGKYEEE